MFIIHHHLVNQSLITQSRTSLHGIHLKLLRMLRRGLLHSPLRSPRPPHTFSHSTTLMTAVCLICLVMCELLRVGDGSRLAAGFCVPTEFFH